MAQTDGKKHMRKMIDSLIIQFSSVAQSCLTLCDPMSRSTPGLPVHNQLPEFTQTHVHKVGDAIQPSHLFCPLLFLPPIPPRIRIFSNESTLHTRWPKYWSSVQLPSNVQFFVTPWTAAHQASLSLTISWSCPSSCPLHWWYHPAISSSDGLFFCPQCFPESGTFAMNQLFILDEQNTRVSASASILQKIIQNWFPFRLTGLIPLLSKRLSGVFSSPTVQRHQFFSVPPCLPSSSHHIMWPLWWP